jgi:hypothetical protein
MNLRPSRPVGRFVPLLGFIVLTVALAAVQLAAGRSGPTEESTRRAVVPTSRFLLDLESDGVLKFEGKAIDKEELGTLLKSDEVLTLRVAPDCRGAVVRRALASLRQRGIERVAIEGVSP